MLLGIDKLIRSHNVLENRRVGVLAHQASLDSLGRPIVNILKESGVDIRALFGPEHGFETKAQDMEPIPNPTDTDLPIPIYSLYGKTFNSLKPTPKMFEGIEVLIVDLQDIGSRYYTYIYTMAFSMQTAAETKTKVIVCDRPNPVNGADVEGALIEKGFESFVGLYPLPVRHGMTIGELANLFNEEHGIGCDLEIIKMEGWKRAWYLDETELQWTNPSPNMRSINAALLYPGMCLLEGTNISEGRGTAMPFELCGAPFINGEEAAEKFASYKLPGIRFHPTIFTPTIQKWAGKKCGGIRFEIIDRKRLKPYATGLALIHTLSEWEGFEWRKAEYEFRSDIPAIDMLTGSSRFRQSIDQKKPFYPLKETETPLSFLETRQRYLLYS